jgi:hypothetical protein
MTLKQISASISLVLALGLTQSCSQANSQNDDTNNNQVSSSKDLYSQIQEAANTEGCTSSSDCGLLPIGNKPCGGPEAYLAYSKTNSDVAKLEQLGKEYSEKRRQYNKDNQVMGTCVVTPKPGVSCVRNQCVTTSNQSSNIQ